MLIIKYLDMTEFDYSKLKDCWEHIPTAIFNDLSYVYDKDGKAIGERYALERKSQVKQDGVTIYMCFGFEGNCTYNELMDMGYYINLEPIEEFIKESALSHFFVQSEIYNYDDYRVLCANWYFDRIINQPIFNFPFYLEKKDEVEPVTD